jgi:hypothetical protein
MSKQPEVATSESPEAGLPVDSLREAAPYLRRPFTPEAIKFKVQTVFGGASGCLVVAYIDARLVIERLNLVVPDMWEAHYEPIDGTKLAWCRDDHGPRERAGGHALRHRRVRAARRASRSRPDLRRAQARGGALRDRRVGLRAAADHAVHEGLSGRIEKRSGGVATRSR